MRDDTNACICEAAVIRAFHELRQKGVSERSAFESAARVYSYHHPEVPHREARFKISEWLAEAS